MKDKSDRRNNPHQRKYDLQLGVRLYPWISLGMPLRSTLINPGSCCTEFRTWKLVADIHVSPTTCPNKPDHLLIIHPVPPRGSQLKWNVWRNSRVPFAINCNHLENSFIFQMPVITTQHLLTKLTTGHRSPTAKVLNVVRKRIPDVRNTFFFFLQILVIPWCQSAFCSVSLLFMDRDKTFLPLQK